MASNSSIVIMPRGWFPAVALALGMMLAPAPGHAFTIENNSNDGSGGAKFDLEEQMRQFRTRDLDPLSPSNRSVETPVGTMQFNVRQGSPFGSSFNSSARAAEDRRHYERMFDPAYLLPR
jgi:hypothetical protein